MQPLWPIFTRIVAIPHERQQARANAIRGRLVVAYATTAPGAGAALAAHSGGRRTRACVAHAQAISWSRFLATPCPLRTASWRTLPAPTPRRIPRCARTCNAAARCSPIPRGQSVDQRSLIVELLAHGGALAAETGVIGDQYAGRLQRTLLV